MYNLQQINMLRLVFDNMLFLLQEGRLQHARKACSRMKKSIFLLQAWPFDEKRGTWQLKYLDNPYWNV